MTWVARKLSDRIAQRNKWHVLHHDGHRGAITLCGMYLSNKLDNDRYYVNRYDHGAPHTLEYSDFPRNARTADRDDTNICLNCEKVAKLMKTTATEYAQI
jgi:hypothetical protein